MKIHSNLEEVSHLRRKISSYCAIYDIDLSVEKVIQLVISEVATNVIRHSTPAATYLTLTCNRIQSSPEKNSDLSDKREEGYTICITLTDNGGFFECFKHRVEQLKSQDPLQPLESGMGLIIVAKNFPDFKYDSCGSENKFSIMIKQVTTESKKRIAIIDDEPGIRALLENYLIEDYQVTTYINGSQALREIRKKPVDLIISDISMPVMDGITLKREFTNTADLESIPFIFLTANDSESMQTQAASLAIDDFLVKPVRKNELLNIVNRVLIRHQSVSTALKKKLDKSVTSVFEPQVPERLGNYTLVLSNISASVGGGDFVVHSGKTSPYVILGDVMGHGKKAKFFVQAFVGYLRSYLLAEKNYSGTAALLEYFSNCLARDSALDTTLLTCLAMQLERQQISISSAGHPAPILIQPQACRELKVSGPLPGLDPEASYSDLSIGLTHQEKLLCYTDGLFEISATKSINDDFRRDFMALLSRYSQETLQKLASRATTFYQRYNATPKDDMTFILIERND